MTEKGIKSKIRVISKEWAKKFKADFRKEMPFTCVIGNKSFIKDQIEFILFYVDHMLLDGNLSTNFKRIKRFLSMQRATNDEKKMKLHFIGGSPIEVFVYVDKLNDIDIADVWGLTEFEEIHIYKEKNKRWTQKSAKSCIKDIKDDLNHDGLKVKLDYKFNEIKNGLYVNCCIE